MIKKSHWLEWINLNLFTHVEKRFSHSLCYHLKRKFISPHGRVISFISTSWSCSTSVDYWANYILPFWTTVNNKVTYFKTTYFIWFLHSLWATWMCCLSFLKESICTIPCVLCWCAWRHTSVWVPDVWTVLVFKLLSLKMICQQSMSVREKILLEEVSCSYSLTPVSCTATQLIQLDF